MTSDWEFVLADISATDQLELLDRLGHDAVSFETVAAGGTKAGEPVTIAVIGISAIAASGLVAYLLKGRRKGRARIESMILRGPAGSIEMRGVELEFSEEDEPKSQLVNALQHWIGAALKGGD